MLEELNKLEHVQGMEEVKENLLESKKEMKEECNRKSNGKYI